jgi:hypothetical protein
MNKFFHNFMTLPCKPHPFGNEYAIADSNNRKPIMWRIKIVEGKGFPKKAGGTFDFTSKYKQMGYTKKIALLLNMTKPIHCKGSFVMGNSGFCIEMGVIVLQKFGVYGQFIYKKQKYLPKYVPGNYINGYMAMKPLC